MSRHLLIPTNPIYRSINGDADAFFQPLGEILMTEFGLLEGPLQCNLRKQENMENQEIKFIFSRYNLDSVKVLVSDINLAFSLI